jgi:hypothetical protein
MKLTIIVPFLFACTASQSDEPQASKRDAGRALSIASSLLDNIDTEAAIRRVLPGTNGTVDYTSPCPTSGSIELDGTFEISDDGLHAEFDVTAGFLACAADSEQLDGSVKWIETRDGDDYTSTLAGTLTWQGAGGSASCTFDLEINNGTISGTACGYDVAELDQ